MTNSTLSEVYRFQRRLRGVLEDVPVLLEALPELTPEVHQVLEAVAVLQRATLLELDALDEALDEQQQLAQAWDEWLAALPVRRESAAS